MTRVKGKREYLLREINVVQYSVNNDLLKLVSVTNAEGPPVPIPNTEVKLCSGENTLRATVREDSPMLTLAKGVPRALLKLETKCEESHTNHIGS